MKNIMTKLVLLFLSFSLVACSSNNSQKENTTVGAVGGAVVGGLAGSLVGAGTGQVVAIGVGAIAGALIGGEIGHRMDHSDNQRMNSAMNNPTNKKTIWHNRKTGTKYTIAPTSSTMSVNGNETCRKYHTSITTSNGTTHHTDGIACLQSNGVWKTISNS